MKSDIVSRYQGIYIAMYSAYDEAGNVDQERVKNSRDITSARV